MFVAKKNDYSLGDDVLHTLKADTSDRGPRTLPTVKHTYRPSIQLQNRSNAHTQLDFETESIEDHNLGYMANHPFSLRNLARSPILRHDVGHV